MIDILKVEEGLWVLEEEGQNVLLKDCLQFGVGKSERKHLLRILLVMVEKLRSGEMFDPLIQQGWIKKLTRQEKTFFENVWEARDPGSHARVIFVIKDPETVIVAAVDKMKSSLSQAVNRGINRWRKYLKSIEL